MRKRKTKMESKNEELLRALVSALVQHPEKVVVKTEKMIDANEENIALRVDPRDMIYAVGGGGRTIQSLRTLFQFIAARDEKTVRVALLDPAERVYGFRKAFVPNPNWKPKELVALLDKTLKRILIEPFQIKTASFEESQTTVEIYPHEGELQLAMDVAPYLQPIFHAIGNTQGREVYLEAKREIKIEKRRRE